jgi:hypothetical protein
MRNVVGAVLVAAAMAVGAPARANPVGAGDYSGLGPCREADRLDTASATDHSLRSAASSLWNDDRAVRFDEDEGLRAFRSFVPVAWTASRQHWDNGLHLGWFNVHNPHWHSIAFNEKRAAKFWADMRDRLKNHHWNNDSGGPDLATNPEPASMILLGSGVLGLFGVRRKRREE